MPQQSGILINIYLLSYMHKIIVINWATTMNSIDMFFNLEYHDLDKHSGKRDTTLVHDKKHSTQKITF